MSLVETAIQYSQLGWSVFPIRAIDDPHPDDPSNDKRPYVKWKECQETRASEKKIRSWWNKFKNARIGIATGSISGIVAIDFDGPTARGQFEAKICDLPDTIMQNTGRPEGGFHALFKHPGNGYDIRPAVGKHLGIDGIDIRADGAYIVVAPSLHKSGKQYQWGKIDPVEHGLDDLLDMPQELLEFCTSPSRYKFKDAPKATLDTFDPEQPKNKPGWVNEILWGVKEGQRNHCCAKLAGYYLRYFSGDEDQAWISLSGWNMRNKPPLEDSELRKVLDSIKAREGINNFSEVVGKSLYNLEILKYPDGEVRYNLYVEGLDEHIQLTPEDLIQHRKFRTKFMVLTRTVMKPVKDETWFRVVEGALQDAQVILMSEDETHIAVVKRLILNDIKRGSFDNPEDHIENVCVIYNNQVHLYLSSVARHLQFQGTRFGSTKELGTVLRMIGFKNGSSKINGKVLRTWRIDLPDFEKTCFLDPGIVAVNLPDTV
uniref:Putative bifunctional DNA primase/polymerase n=1 Tax=viral metagenome TaxID=1070528 RepID=A0A6M3JU18_9ZZZZ